MFKTIGVKIEKAMVRRIAFPILNHVMSRHSTSLVHYNERCDQLFPFNTFDGYAYDAVAGRMADFLAWRPMLLDMNLKGQVVLDVGAGVGHAVAEFASHGAVVYTFEPNPRNVARVKQQIDIRRIKNATVVPVAVADKDGTATLSVRAGWGHHSIADSGKSKVLERITVDTITVDSFLEQHDIESVECLKIDVEGFEPEVLDGARRALSAHRIANIIIEYSPTFYRHRGIEPRSVLDRITMHGYKLFDTQGLPFSVENEALDIVQIDLLARQ